MGNVLLCNTPSLQGGLNNKNMFSSLKILVKLLCNPQEVLKLLSMNSEQLAFAQSICQRNPALEF